MKTIQITLLDELHRRAKALALANTTLKQFFQDAIEAHVVRMEAVTPSSSSFEQGGRDDDPAGTQASTGHAVDSGCR